ncbi:MAG: AbiV family abortive infection protein [Nitrospirae bacterium]|nr:AbiV family abortive infection protein [Nitrospirota bacterium]
MGDLEYEVPVELMSISDACLNHAKDLLQAAQRLCKGNPYPHISYHLATLALEEIGKSQLIIVNYCASFKEDSSERATKWYEDHEKKLFWALWGPLFCGSEVITDKKLNELEGLAKTIHETRLRGLYVDPLNNSAQNPKDIITSDNARMLIALAKKRLRMEGRKAAISLSEDERQNLSWFLLATNDIEKRRIIFGRESFEKLAGLGQVSAWVEWLRQKFDKAEAEGRAMAEKELQRPAPSEEEADKDKWKLKIRLFTNSHSIRPKPLNWWNNSVNGLNIFPTNNRSEMIIEITLSNRVSTQALWSVGWYMARRFIASLNIGSMGFFWWYMPEQVSRYYERLRDIETNLDFNIDRNPTLRIDWKRGILSEQDLINTALCFPFFPGPDEKVKQEPFDNYLRGLGLLSKTDIHMQFEANAFECFYNSLRGGMRQYGAWNGTGSFIPIFYNFMSEFMTSSEDMYKYLKYAEILETPKPNIQGLTLGEVGTMKILCDTFFNKTFRHLSENRHAQGVQ